MKRIIHILLILMTVISLSSCIEARREFTDHGEIYEDREWDLFPEGHLVDEPITISYWSANSAVDHQGTTQAQLVDQFNAMQRENYPDSPIKVVASFQGGYNTQNQKLQAALMGNNNPEIAMIGISSLALYLDYAVDMREIFTYDEIRNIYEGFLQFAMYQQKFVGYPYFAATNAFIVNKTRWNQTGLPFPSIETIVNNPEESIWTWEALKAAAEAMTVVESDETKYGLAVNGIPIYESLFTQGVAPYDPIATKAIFNNEAGLKAFTYWQNMAKNGYMGNPAEDPNHNTKIQAAFSSGDVGMLFASSSGFKVISEQVGDDFELDVLPFPKVSNFYSNQSGGGLVIFNNKSKARQKAAVEFLRWLQADEQVIQFAKTAGYLPSTYSSIETQAWLDHVQTHPILSQTIELMRIKLPKGLVVPSGRAKSLADIEFTNYSLGIFLDGTTRDPEVVLTDTYNRVNVILRQNK
ncbi:MAG: extracellular solute-binding protein [Acholeplasmataceae bacterium]|jgi:sn-glycerol 3-phosphate transport system substrate-binding protein|nr:extracellular solute-binding protein [Acholeplasmataceae bacterium]